MSERPSARSEAEAESESEAGPGAGSEAGSELTAEPDAERVRLRAAELLPEERAAGSADPLAQAAAVLADSNERTDGVDDVAAPAHFPEHRRSEDTVDPVE